MNRYERVHQDNPVLKTCYRVYDRISEQGHTHENTKELIDLTMEVSIKSLDPDSGFCRWASPDLLWLDLVDYYGSDYAKRADDEAEHYKFLKYGLLHKVKEIKYFFHSGIENRKTILLSQDCISSIQYLKREKSTWLIVYMRSSDVESLLPMDTVALCQILRAMNEAYAPDEVDNETVVIHIGSAHYYLSGGRA